MTKCLACGGILREVCAPGRKRVYLGDSYDIPDTFLITTCEKCGSEWMSTHQIRKLNALFENIRRERLIQKEYGDGSGDD